MIYAWIRWIDMITRLPIFAYAIVIVFLLILVVCAWFECYLLLRIKFNGEEEEIGAVVSTSPAEGPPPIQRVWVPPLSQAFSPTQASPPSGGKGATNCCCCCQFAWLLLRTRLILVDAWSLTTFSLWNFLLIFALAADFIEFDSEDLEGGYKPAEGNWRRGQKEGFILLSCWKHQSSSWRRRIWWRRFWRVFR